MRDLNYQLKQLCRHNRNGGYATQQRRERELMLIADQLHALGYRGMSAQSLKPKHVEALVARWEAESISVGTIKNRMATLRWWAEKVNRRHVIARDNVHYGIPERVSVSNESKALTGSEETLDCVRDQHVRLSLELQRAFGLRREEAIKLQPSYADRGVQLLLKESWTKGGKARSVPVLTEAQRELLARIHALAGRGSLIPPARSYIQQLRIYERYCGEVGLSKMHGLRHVYAHARYVALTGWAAPAAGGPRPSDLSASDRERDRAARLAISGELGNEREAIVAAFLGR